MLFKSILCALALTCSGVALADKYTTSQGSTHVAVDTEKACHADMLPQFPKELHERLRAGVATHEGKQHKICFVEMENEIYVFWDDGDQGLIPKSVFTPVKEI